MTFVSTLSSPPFNSTLQKLPLSLTSRNISMMLDANPLLARSLIPPKYRHLRNGDLIALDRVWLGKEGAHVCDEGISDLGRQF
jgi:hypothetical protein